MRGLAIFNWLISLSFFPILALVPYEIRTLCERGRDLTGQINSYICERALVSAPSTGFRINLFSISKLPFHLQFIWYMFVVRLRGKLSLPRLMIAFKTFNQVNILDLRSRTRKMISAGLLKPSKYTKEETHKVTSNGSGK